MYRNMIYVVATILKNKAEILIARKKSVISIRKKVLGGIKLLWKVKE